MKCKIPEISWHNRDPVLSVDIQPKANVSNNYRLASGGTDAHVLIWYMKFTMSGVYGDIELDLAADLTRHQRAVNVVKWSPNGELLASGDDESVVFIWKQKSDSDILDSTNEQDKEVWITLKVLRGHMEDIYDLSWAPNSLYLVSGSVDNSAMIWDIQKGKSIAILNDHKGFVQGVAWDPKNQYIATLSTDRYMRIFDIQTKKVLYRVSKSTLPVPEDSYLYDKRMRLFYDDTLQTFFRRLSFTPDGKLLLTPAGIADYDGCTRPLNTTYIFSRYAFRQPAIVLPCPDQYTVAVKCCPLLFKLRHFAEKNPPVVPLPYRIIFAVATKSSVYFYDTQQKQPFAVISNIHYTRLTDISWSNDGRIVVVSSTDGFCSLITFEEGELGEEYENSEAALEAALAQVTKKTKKQKDSEVTAKSRMPSTDDTAVGEKETASKEPQMETIADRGTKKVLTETKHETDCPHKTREVEEIPKKDTNEIETSSVQGLKEVGEQEKTVLSINVKDNGKPTVTKVHDDNTPKLIAIKRKQRRTAESFNISVEEDCEIKGSSTKSSEVSKCTTNSPVIASKVLVAEIIIDKEILSSDERFESPDKKSRPATPITIRRHPRTPTSLPERPTSMANILKNQPESKYNSPISSLPRANSTTLENKKAKSIVVRRTPRLIISAPSVVHTTSIVEEANDAWPLDKESVIESTKETFPHLTVKSNKEDGITTLPVSEIICERTEDIRLVYEETNEETPSKDTLRKQLYIEANKDETVEISSGGPIKSLTPKVNKTPRRVAFKTISTPKWKKKLID